MSTSNRHLLRRRELDGLPALLTQPDTAARGIRSVR